MGGMASQIISLPIVYSTIYSDTDQRKHQSSASLAFVRGIHRWPVNSPHKWPVTQKMFPYDDVIMLKQHKQIQISHNLDNHWVCWNWCNLREICIEITLKLFLTMISLNLSVLSSSDKHIFSGIFIQRWYFGNTVKCIALIWLNNNFYHIPYCFVLAQVFM